MTNFLKALFIVSFMLIHALPASADDVYDAMGNWELNNTQGDINVSTFNYLDMNRNGEYDEGDQPISGVANNLYDANDQLLYKQTTNRNGWGNFNISKFKENSPINAPGIYQFEVLPPPGWLVSSGNAKQSVTVKEVYGSIGGLGAEQMPVPIGLMPDLYIAGHVSNAAPKDSITLVNTQNNETKTLDLDAENRFRFEALEPVKYRLEYQDSRIDVELKSFPMHVGDVSAERSDKPANQVAGFDDIAKAELRKVPNGYKGLRWFNINAMQSFFTSGAVGYVNGTLSEDFIAYLSSGHPAKIYRDKPFAFQEAAFTNAWPASEGETLIVEYFNGDEKRGEDHITLTSFGPVLYRPQRSNITEIRLHTKHYWQAVLEDLRFTVE